MSLKKNLFNASGLDDSDDELKLNTNKDYAKSYNKFRQKELLKKFKDRGQDVSESESSSETESSDEEEIVNPKFDQEFFRTLASLKSRNPDIYDKNTRFFEGIEDSNSVGDGEESKDKKASCSSKPVTLNDYERKIIVENGGKFEDDSDAEHNENDERSTSPAFVEEERRIKAEFKKVMNEDNSEEEEFGGIFKKRVKTKQENEKEDEDFTNWLAGKNIEVEENVKNTLAPLKSYWSSSKLPQSEKFLRDYILNKGYADTNFADIPTYDEIIGDNYLSEDEQELEKQTEFEQKYNFRFEEPDSEFLKRYPRTIENSVRVQDQKRKQKRTEIKERKQNEKQQKMQEFEVIKEMKRKEIEEKIQKLKEVTGNDELGFNQEELEDDFDPEAHDRRMQELFNDDYYQVDEGEEKPECPSDIEELKFEDWDNYDPVKGAGDDDDFEPHCEDEDFNMDCDYDPIAAKEALQHELIENTKRRKTRKGRRSQFMEMIQAEKPIFDPEDEKTYADYIDEYYKLDCEDVIGDIPCRFKYVETTPNDFGLTIEEILLAKNKELNQWASLKKATQIRPDHLEKKEQRVYKMKAKNEQLKRKIFKSLYGESSDDEASDERNDVNEGSKHDFTQNKLEKEDQKISNKKSRKRKAESLVKSNQNPFSNKESAATVLEAKKEKLPTETSSPSDAINNTNELQQQAKTNKTKKKKKNKKINTTANSSANTNDKTHNPFIKQLEIQPPDGKKPANLVPHLKNKNPKNLKLAAKNSPQQKRVNVKNKLTKNPFANNRNISEKSKISDERLKAYGINPKKFNKKQKYGNKQV